MSPDIQADREAFLHRVRGALDRTDGSAPEEGSATIPAGLVEHAERIREAAAARWEELLSRFTTELEAVAGVIHRAAASDLPMLVSRIAKERQLSRVLMWSEGAVGLPGLGERLQVEGFEVTDASMLESPEGIEAIRARVEKGEIGLTGADYAIAETGSLVLLSGAGKGRLVSALPMVHVAILRPGHLVGTLEEVGVLLEATHLHPAADFPSAITFITGPSRTADIGLSLTRGAHGPKEVHVIALS